jgi:hypothetical protein
MIDKLHTDTDLEELQRLAREIHLQNENEQEELDRLFLERQEYVQPCKVLVQSNFFYFPSMSDSDVGWREQLQNQKQKLKLKEVKLRRKWGNWYVHLLNPRNDPRAIYFFAFRVQNSILSGKKMKRKTQPFCLK